ncbi:MAG: hypothetical protein OXF02_01735 [Simkaniaceae bacterium]|nr:hypothetical protein [Simkaniaceae bacterium]
MFRLSYCVIRVLLFPCRLMTAGGIRRCGNVLGSLVYRCVPSYRKRTLSNLALATDLALSEEEIRKTAEQSLQSMAITFLEYERFARIRHIDDSVSIRNREPTFKLFEAGQGIILLCGHQANWEAAFLEVSDKIPVTAINRPIKNPFLHNYLVRIRTRFGGKLITPKETISRGTAILRQGGALAIVCDQGMPESKYVFPFFGRRARTSVAPALLSYRTGAPIIFATIRRKGGRYEVHYSDPVWPNRKETLKEEIRRLTCAWLAILEKSVIDAKEQWLWLHNRWKQQVPTLRKRRYRAESILIILPKESVRHRASLHALRTVYPRAFITILTPLPLSLPDAEVLLYRSEKELFLRDYRFKLVFDFSRVPGIKKHFLRLSAFRVIDEKTLYKEAGRSVEPRDDLSRVIEKALI